MDVPRAFSFVFKDPRWFTRLAVAAALLLVPIIGWLLLAGYWLRLLRHVVARNDVPLPEWDGWTELFVSGLKGVVVVAIWSLAPFLLFLVPSVVGADRGPVAVLWLLGALLGLVAVVVTPAALARLAMARSLAAGTEAGRVLRMVDQNPRDYLVVLPLSLLVAVLLWGVLSFVTVVSWLILYLPLGLVGFILAIPVSVVVALIAVSYVQLVLFHLFGQAYYRTEPTAWHAPAD